MSTTNSGSISIDFDKTVGITDFIPEMSTSWNPDLSEPLWAILGILFFILALLIFFFPFWYVISLRESTERIESILMELGHRADPLEDKEERSCPTS